MAQRSEVRTQVEGRRLTLSNLEKVLFPAVGFTKAEVIDYYLQVAPVMLPHVTDRPMTRLRFPNGVDGSSFYEKNAPMGSPDWVRTEEVLASEGPIRYVVADDAATLVWLANLAALEMHVPQWRFGSRPEGGVRLPEAAGDEAAADRPEPLHTQLVVDLDPGEGTTMVESARAALLVAGPLAEAGLLPVCRTSGSKGLQVYAAIAATPGVVVRDWVRDLAARLVTAHPETFVDQVSKTVRQGRVYLDYNQNQTFRNTIAPYSLRGRERPGVATPLTWDEVGSVSRPDDLRFGPDEVLARISEHGDLAADLLLTDAPELPADR